MSAQELLERYAENDAWKGHVALWQQRTNEQLQKEFHEFNRAMYGAFKDNAKVARNILASILLGRGMTHIPNIFGDIEIKII